MNATGLADPLIGRLLERRYRVTGIVARGGMATVYTARDERLDRDVAVKVMHPALAEDPDFVARFQREARAAARIAAPNVVAVIDAGVDGTTAFLVMELVRGRTLRALLRERGRLNPSQTLEILEPVAAALAAAHRAGVVHRDVKPENVLLADDGSVKVADFGLARAIAASQLTATTGLLLGTVSYIAPEQVSHGQVDPRGDVYAAGVMAFELLTGAPPYDADTPLAIAYRHVHDEVPAPSQAAPGIPPAVDELVLAATARDPQARLADGDALAAAIRRVRRVVPPDHDTRILSREEALATVRPAASHPTAVLDTTPPASPAAVPARRPRRRRVWSTVVVVMLVLLTAAAAVAGWWFGSGRYVRVPHLVGLAPAAAERQITGDHLHWRLDPAKVYSDTVPAGLVAGQRPGPGAQAVRGHAVVLLVSQGPRMETVPQLAGLTLDAARLALTRHQLALGAVTSVYSTAVAPGTVVSASPHAGLVVRHATPVQLTISQGPAPVTIPSVTGEPVAQAQATLTALGLHTTVTSAYNATVTAGDVVSESPQSGTTAHQGDSVSLVESLGPPYVTMPDVTGDSPAQAESLLTQLGLHYHVEQFPGSPGVDVVHQSVASGTRLRVGSTVTLYVF